MQLSSHGKPVGYSVVSKSSETSNKALRAMLMMGSYVLEVMGVPDKEVWYRELSDESLSLESDEYTTCVHDVALANLDMCIGDWWLTQEASDLEVPFVPVYHEDIKLILRRQPLRDTSFDSALAKFTSGLTRAIEPFEPDLWACILVTMLAASLIMAIVERDHGAPFAVGEAIYLASASFASFGSAYEPRTPGGRVMGLGIAFFLTVVGASFTANTAQFFIQVASSRVEYQSLQEVLDAGKKVCVGAAGLKRALLGKYPTLRELGEEVELQDGEFPNMELHNCYGWVGPKDLVVDAWHSNALDSCEYEFVGHSVHQFFMGYYVTPSLFHPAAYAVSLLRGNGTWSQIHQEVWPNEVTGCTSEAQEGPMRLSAEHMLGPNAFLLLCCLLSLLLHFFCQVARRVRGMASLAAESEGSSSAGSSAGGTPADSAEDT
ncbi:unnamed protein product [Prorocentrum cordatum]|nr:unnamed protein product [Polarella glacialis]